MLLFAPPHTCACSPLAVQYGDAAAGGDPQLWAEALDYFVGQPGDCSAAISEVLRHIEAGALLPPLVVLQTLAKDKQLKVWASWVRLLLGQEFWWLQRCRPDDNNDGVKFGCLLAASYLP